MEQNRRTLALAAATLLAAACGRPSSSAPADAAPVLDPATPSASAGGGMFTNGGFESDAIGTTPPTGWTVLNYLNSTGVSGTPTAPPSSFSALNLSGLGTAVNETFVVGGAALSQVDPDLGAGQSFRFPAYDSRNARVNYKDATATGKNKNANLIRQSMAVGLSDVDPTDGQVHVRFAVAPVLENPSHSYNQQPYFFIELLDLTKGTKLYSAFNVAGQAGVPWHTTTSVLTGNSTQWLDWQLVDIAPGNAALAIGDQLQLTVVASGCSLGGHFGRIYVDGIGAFIPGPFVSASAAASVPAGSTLTYTVNYSNGGTGPSMGTHVDMVTPPSTTFAAVSGAPATCTTPTAGTAGTISCPLGTLNPGATGSFTVTVNVSASATGTIVNGNYSIGSVNATTLLGAKVTTSVISSSTQTADVAVVKTGGYAALQAGQVVASGSTPIYTITITNNSATKAISTSATPSSTFTFTDVIPSQITGATWAVTVTAAGTVLSTRPRDNRTSTTYNGSGNTISFKPRLGAGGQLTIKVYGTVSASATGNLTNTASGNLTGLTDPNPANNSSSVTTPIGTIVGLTVTKAGTGAGTVVSAPAGISCGSTCSTNLLTGSSVVLTASPTGSASFAGWSGTGAPAACTTGAPRTCTVTMSAARSVTATFTAAPAVGPAALVYLYSGSPQLTSTSAAFTSPLRVLVTDANGVPVSGATVSFAAVPAGGASATLSSGSATTSASGLASITATANATAGSYTVTATVSGLAPVSFALTNVGAPASVTYVNGGNLTDPQLAPVSTVFGTSLLAQVRDAAGNVVPNVTVTYTAVPVGGASATLSGVTTTDSAGLSTATATANATAGNYTVTASVAGVATPATFYLHNVSTGPGAIYVVSGTPQTAALTTAFGLPLVVVVADAAGNALPGVTVSFSASTVGGATATLSATSGTTDASGQASVTATSNGTGGTYTVSASVVGIATPATFTLANDGGFAIAVSAGSDQIATISTSYLTALSVLVTNASDAPASGEVVTFSAPASGPSVTLGGGTACTPASSNCRQATTDASGLASVTAVANSLAGTFTVSASTSNAPGTADFALTSQCTASSQCAGITPICGGGACAACTSNTECLAASAATPYCAASGACVACTSDAQCGGTAPICSQATSTCVACTTDAQCSNKDAASPACVTGSGACVAIYTLTPSAGPHGAINPAAATTVTSGADQTFSITPESGYHVADVLVDGASVGAVTSYPFSNVTANHGISASFAIDTFTLTASAGLGGLVSPSGAVSVDYGAGQTFTITPLAGHHVADVLVDGASVGAVTSYPFSNVTANHGISASFAVDTFTVTTSAGAHGVVSPLGAQAVSYGGALDVQISADTGYHVADVVVDGASVGAVTSWSFASVSADQTLAATFAPDAFTITASAGAHGSISPSGAVAVTYGASQAFTIAGDPGYGVLDVLVDGVSVGAVGSYSFNAIAGSHTISATFHATSTAATVTLDAGSLSAVYDGTPKAVSATTSPSGLSLSIAYGGSTTAPSAAGTYAVVATVTSPGYTGTGTGTLVIAKATPTISWSNPAAITYGTPLSATQLNATASVPGTLTYSPAAGAVLNAGPSQTLSVSFAPTDSTNYASTSATVVINVNRATPTISWSNPAAITYGTPLSATQLNATASVPGTLTYSPAAGAVLNAGPNQTLSVSFAPTDSTNYASTSATVVINVSRATPTISWSNPAAITYGTPLSATQLNATASVPGTLTYSPAAGAVLNAGPNQTLSVSFAPTDSTNYASTSATVTIDVGQAPQAITFAPPLSHTYGGPPLDLAPFATGGDSGNPITFAVVSGPGNLAGSVLSFVGAGSIVVSASQAGNSNYTAAPTVQATLSVGRGVSVTTLSASPSPSVFGQVVTLTVHVSATAAGTIPSGTVTIAEGAAVLCPAVALAAGSGSCTTATLAVGSHSLTATYGGDTDFAGSSGAAAQLVSRGSTSLVLGSGPQPSVPGQPVTFTATVAPLAPASGNPGGTVTFTDGTTVLCAAVPLAAGVATCEAALATAGAHAILATYSGDGSFTGATGPLSHSVQLGPTATLVAASPSPSSVGEAVTYTASVAAAAPASGTPSGSVTFSDGATTLCAAVPLVSGTASCTSAALAVGGHTVTALYAGDLDFAPSSGSTAQQVLEGSSQTTLAAAPSPSRTGQLVTLTATVAAAGSSAGTPSGAVAFTDGASTLCAAAPLTAGAASCTTTALAVGSHHLVASYAGDGSFTPSSGSATHQVQPGDASLALAAAPAPAVSGQPVTFSALVTAVAPAAGTPTGTVTFTDGATTVCAAAPIAAGVATCTSSTLQVGGHTVVATYPGDASFGPATQSTSVTVAEAPGALVVASSRNPSRAGVPVTFTAALTYPYAAPTGAVTFRADGELLGNAPISGGSASLTVRTLVRGTHAITAQFTGGDGLAPASGELAGGQRVENTPPVAGSGSALAFGAGASLASGSAPTGALDAVQAAELWVRALPGSADGATLLRLGAAASPALSLTLQPARAGVVLTLGATAIAVPAPLDTGTWHHLAVSISGGVATVRVDGLAVTEVPATLDAAGATAVVLGDGLAGELDEVRLWSDARSAAAVTADLRRPVPADAPGLTALWRLDEGAGLEAFDAGPAGVDLAVAADAGVEPFVASTAWRDRQVLEERTLTPIDAGYDADGDPLTLTVASAPAHGTTAVDAGPLHLAYTGATGFVGLDVFTFQLDDGAARSQYLVQVEVQPTVECRVDADCATDQYCAGGTCTPSGEFTGRAASVGCGSAGAAPTALAAALLTLLLLRRRRPRTER